MANWADVQNSASNTPSRIVLLSGMGQTLIGTAYFDLYNMRNWKGAGYELTETEIDEIKAAVDALIRETGFSVMIGAFLPYAGLNSPNGTLPCDGETYNRVDYPELYEYLIDSPYMVDEDTFTTPLFPDRAVTMASETNAAYSEYGEETHALTEDENAAHTHTESAVGTTLSAIGEIPALLAVASASVTGSSGLGEPHNNVPPSIAFNWCIVSGR